MGAGQDRQEGDAAFDGKAFARRLPTRPGVYVMRDAEGGALYVGKALDLRKRVGSYFDARPKVERIMRMVEQIASIEIGLTRSEGEALLLENEWIKSLKPRYNVLLRDDKSYPWIMLTTDHPYPRIAFHRGARDAKRTYLGPYPSASSVRESINLIQKLFRLRNCEDSVYANRSRPCLQYQIRRCTAPCVGRVDEADYARQLDDALLFLRGDRQSVMRRLIRRMERAAEAQEYEQAAEYRDQINALKQMQAQHFVTSGNADVDVVALAQAAGRTVIGVMTVRGGRNLGQRSYFPSQVSGHGVGEVLEAFLGQYYAERGVPPLVIVSHPVDEAERLEVALGEAVGRKVRIQPRPRGERRQWLELARRNATSALELKLAGQGGVARQLADLADLLGLEDTPGWIECFDISHTQGNQAVGACVAFDRDGPAKSRYRRYNLRDITPGDDYAAMHQVLTRRYRHAAESDGEVPDLLIIDGGRGQVSRALEALDEVGLEGVPLIGVSKGAERRAGYEQWVIPGRAAALEPGPEAAASHLVQRIRDEAHRFAITGHRGRRQKATVGSVLEDIPGIGAKRRRALLTHFGGLKGVRKAAVEDLESVPGINRQLAEKIFRALH